MKVKREVTICFPPDERYGLTSQCNRAAISIPLNIAEGAGRSTDRDFAHFLDTALGSCNELDYCCYAATELGYLRSELSGEIETMIGEVRAMLIGLINHVRKQATH